MKEYTVEEVLFNAPVYLAVPAEEDFMDPGPVECPSAAPLLEALNCLSREMDGPDCDSYGISAEVIIPPAEEAPELLLTFKLNVLLPMLSGRLEDIRELIYISSVER